jgi:hypothetical protein
VPGSIDLEHLRELLIHTVLPCDVVGTREVVNFLVSAHILVKVGLETPRNPHHGPVFLVLLVSDLPEAIIFQGKLDYFGLRIEEFEIIAPIWRLVRLDRNRIIIGSKDQRSLLSCHFIPDLLLFLIVFSFISLTSVKIL